MGGKTMICRECKRIIADNSVFCEYCGRKVITDTHDEIKNKKPKVMITVLSVMVLVMAFCAVIVYFSNRNKFNYDYSDYKEEERYDEVVYDSVQTPKVDEVINTNGIYYKIDGTTLVISGNGILDKKTINSFSKKAFDSVLFESGNIDIPDDTFSGFSNIKKVELKNVVNRIGAGAFKGCGFYLIAIGESISEIGEDAFADCAISDVYLNNPQIRANLDSRYDFGGLFENASTIAIFSGTTEYECSDFTVEDSQWGQYLRENEEYNKLKSIASPSKVSAKRAYDVWANSIRPGFYHFNYVGLESPKTTYGGGEYDAETNTLILDD